MEGRKFFSPNHSDDDNEEEDYYDDDDDEEILIGGAGNVSDSPQHKGKTPNLQVDTTATASSPRSKHSQYLIDIDDDDEEICIEGTRNVSASLQHKQKTPNFQVDTTATASSSQHIQNLVDIEEQRPVFTLRRRRNIQSNADAFEVSSYRNCDLFVH